jgi:8-oxo-dGTP pyrophosphatase MutT (NUDIX family)
MRPARTVEVTTPRPAATLMVVRDGPDPDAPLEVLMLRRSLRADFVGGAHVFPGGAVDPGDGDRMMQRFCPGLSDEAASAALRVTSGGLAFWVAAVRECFEEAGLLLACGADGTPVAFVDPGVAERFAGHRRALNSRTRSFLEVCELEGLRLSVDSLHYFAHWITPEGSPRRYDTRFFVAEAPEGQTPAHDAAETISDVWVRPHDALARHRAGEMELILPTIRNLQAIGRFATAAELLVAAAAPGEIPTVLPRVVTDSSGAQLLLPGDPGYDAPIGLGAGDPGKSQPDFDAAARMASRAANQAEGWENDEGGEGTGG